MPVWSVVGLIALTVGLVALIPSVIGISQNRHLLRRVQAQQQTLVRLAKEGAEAHAGTCALIGDLKTREKSLAAEYRDSITFLRANPDGIGVFTPALIRAAADRQAAALSSARQTREVLEAQVTCVRGGP